MATYQPPKRGVEYIFYVGLVSQADAKLLKANPTLAAGDVQISKDGGAFANLTTLPTVTPASGKAVKVTVSATEMTSDNVTIVFSDAAGAEWCDLIINIATAARQIDDLATPTNITAGTITTATNLTNLPAIPNNWLTAAGIAADAITDAKVAADVTIASVTGAVGSVAGQTLANLDVASSTLATAANLATVAGYIDTEVASILAAVDTEVAAIKAKTDNLPGATMAELAQGVPPATPSLEQALMALYMTLRNRLDVTATTKSVTNDAGTVIFKKALSDDGTTYSEAEAVSGP